MRLLVCGVVAGCGGLDLYEVPDVPADSADTIEEDPAVPWEGPDDGPGLPPGFVRPHEGPLHLLHLSEAASPLVPALESRLSVGDDLVFRLDMIDPPSLEGRLVAMLPEGLQDFCQPTIDVAGAFDGEVFRIRVSAETFRPSQLPWRSLVLAGSLVDDALLDVVIEAELAAADVPLADPCAELGCHRCSDLPGMEPAACVHIPLDLAAEPLEPFVIEPMTPGDAAAACE